MPIGKSKKKKSASRKSAKPAVRKKALKKKPAKKKAGKTKPAQKKITVKKALKNNAAQKTARKKTVAKKKTASKKTVPDRSFSIEPGPPAGPIPSVEEPARHEEAVGIVTHYFSHLSVAIVQINTGSLKPGDTIHIHGHSTDFTQTVESMEYEHRHIDQATPGQSVGLLVKDHVRVHDIVYLVK